MLCCGQCFVGLGFGQMLIDVPGSRTRFGGSQRCYKASEPSQNGEWTLSMTELQGILKRSNSKISRIMATVLEMEARAFCPVKHRENSIIDAKYVCPPG